MYQITADDGRGNATTCVLPRERLCSVISGAILIGTIATQKIEGENTEGVTLGPSSDLPEALLKTN